MLCTMITGHFRWTAAVALAASVLWAAYEGGGVLLAGACLALLLFALMGLRWIGAARRRGEVLHDPAISTLVFPPESKFQSSVIQRH